MAVLIRAIRLVACSIEAEHECLLLPALEAGHWPPVQLRLDATPALFRISVTMQRQMRDHFGEPPRDANRQHPDT